PHPSPTLFPYTTLFRSRATPSAVRRRDHGPVLPRRDPGAHAARAHDQQRRGAVGIRTPLQERCPGYRQRDGARDAAVTYATAARSEEHTSELQSLRHLV